MNPEEQRVFDETQASLKEIGVVPEEKTEEQPADKEQPEEEAPKTEEVKAEDEESEDDESEESEEDADDEEADDESDEDDIPPQFPKKVYKDLKANLQKDFDQKLEKMRQEFQKKAPDEVKTDELESELEVLSKELNFDKDKLKKIIDVARKGIEMSPEDRALLNEYKENRDYIKTKQAEDSKREEQQYFATEWSKIEVQLKKDYPNATPEQLSKAKAEMDRVSHTKKYHQTELDYVLFKEKDAFGKILFSPKQKTFEVGKTNTYDDTEEFPEFNVNFTPKEFEAFEKRRNAMMDSAPAEKLRVRTTDQTGRVVEREV